MAFFNSFTDSLKQKWLQFFQVNREWITLHMEVESVYTPDGGKRPPSYLILGVVNALEPKLAQLMLPFARLNPDADTLIEVLDLNFDPDIVLGNRVIPKAEIDNTHLDNSEDVTDEDYDDTTPTNHHHINGFGEKVIGLEIDTDGETLLVPHTTIDDAVAKIHNQVAEHSSIQNKAQHESNVAPVADVDDEFGDISFDDLKEADDTTNGTTTSGEGEFADVLSDVWGNESANKEDQADSNDMFLGEDLSSSELDDSEIASLFPKN